MNTTFEKVVWVILPAFTLRFLPHALKPSLEYQKEHSGAIKTTCPVRHEKGALSVENAFYWTDNI